MLWPEAHVAASAFDGSHGATMLMLGSALITEMSSCA